MLGANFIGSFPTLRGQQLRGADPVGFFEYVGQARVRIRGQNATADSFVEFEPGEHMDEFSFPLEDWWVTGKPLGIMLSREDVTGAENAFVDGLSDWINNRLIAAKSMISKVPARTGG